MPFYAIYVPSNSYNALAYDNNGLVNTYIFTNKAEALDALRLHKESRVREFSILEEARDFVINGSCNSKSNSGSKKTTEIIITSPSPTKAVNLEKAQFRAPSKQELTDFRKKIETSKNQADYDYIKRIIWDNPRYLVGSGDTPSNLKEGYRYNAMHICAQTNKPEIAELILQTVSDPDFISLYSGRKTQLLDTPAFMNANLLDYYLNMPEKGRYETPLHFAAKFGHVKVVKVLVSYPECKFVRNSDGLLPKEIICQRAKNSDPDVHKEIEMLLSERYYVPVFRAEDNIASPKVGEPFSPNKNKDSGFMQSYDESNLALRSKIQVKALAGPMTKEHAEKFCRRWRTPPSTIVTRNGTIFPGNSPYISPISNKLLTFNHGKTLFKDIITPIRRQLFSFNFDEDGVCNKQLENDGDRIDNVTEISTSPKVSVIAKNTEINHNHSDDVKAMRVPLTYIQSNDQKCFENSESSEASFSINNGNISFASVSFHTIASLDDSNLANSPSFKERHIKNSDIEKGLEVIGRKLAKQENIEWREYWDFLDTFVDLSSEQGLNLLEHYLKAKKPNANANTSDYDAFCGALAVLSCNSEATEIRPSIRNSPTTTLSTLPINELQTDVNPQVTIPYTYVEKSLQVFAKRMTKIIMNNINDELSMGDTLCSELKRLKSLICSFKNDERFKDVDFTKVHYRISLLIVNYIRSAQNMSELIEIQIAIIMRNILTSLNERREHFECLCNYIIDLLDSNDSNYLERIITEEMCIEKWVDSESCTCKWELNALDRKTLRRKRSDTHFLAQSTDRESAAQNQVKDAVATEKVSTTAWRSNNNSGDTQDVDPTVDEFEDEKFHSSISSDNEDDFQTPPETPKRASSTSNDIHSYNVFIFGDKPTKRDLDVYSAICQTDIDVSKYPRVNTWKMAIQSYSKEEMNLFPTPLSKINSPSKCLISSPKLTNSSTQCEQRSTFMAFGNKNNVTNSVVNGDMNKKITKVTSTTTSPDKQVSPSNLQLQMTYRTPLNKVRGLFSQYRDNISSKDSLDDIDGFSPLTPSPLSNSSYS